MIPHPWTWSHIEAHGNCAKKYYHLQVAKDVPWDPPGEALMWGRKVHTAFENRINYNTPLPEGMPVSWENMARKILALPGEKYVEQELAIDANFQPSAWKGAWSRGKTDLLVLNGTKAATMDYKTGKFKPSDQLRLYAAYILINYPQVDEVETAFIWLKDKKMSREKATRKDVPMIWQDILPAVRKLEHSYTTNTWPAKPSGLCKEYCPVVACEHNGRRAK